MKKKYSEKYSAAAEEAAIQAAAEGGLSVEEARRELEWFLIELVAIAGSTRLAVKGFLDETDAEQSKINRGSLQWIANNVSDRAERLRDAWNMYNERMEIHERLKARRGSN